MAIIQIFIYLQLLDALTTLVGFRLGAMEASPAVRMLMHVGPGIGLAASKIVALVLGGYCIYSGRHRLIRLANYWYGGLVVWNLMIILALALGVTAHPHL